MDAQEFEERWFTRWQRTGPAVRNELRVTAQRLLQLSKGQMADEIYSKAEDDTPSGRPRWRRSGALYQSEELEEETPDRIVLVNHQPYAHRRHEANKPGFPYKVNPSRTAHWRDDAMKQLREERSDALARLGLRILRGDL